MERKPLNYLLIALLSIGLSACGKKDTFVKTEAQPTLTQTLDTYLDANIADNQPGTAIMVIKDGEVAYKNAKGMANINTGQSITSQSGFRLASISKTFTALAIMQLYQRQQLNLNDSVLVYLPELPASWQSITVHHLLTHQSGIPNYYSSEGIDLWPDGVTNQYIIDYYTAHPAVEFVPGEQSQYSNTGYVLLAQIISRISGLGFADFMAINIFDPLGMSQTYVGDEFSQTRSDDVLNFATDYTLFGRRFFASGAVGMISSLDDMQIFMKALLAGDIVEDETLQLMLEHHSIGIFDRRDYGYGLILYNNGVDAFMHTGGNDGFRTFMLINREMDLQLVIMGNGGDETAHHDYISQLIGEYYGQQ